MEESYVDHVVKEIEKFSSATDGDEINLWFEYELFCGTNYWFCLYLLKDSDTDIYRVAPTLRDASTKWLGFGSLRASEMGECFAHRVKLNADDIKLGRDLWLAVKSGDKDRLLELGSSASPAFHTLSMIPKRRMRSTLSLDKYSMKLPPKENEISPRSFLNSRNVREFTASATCRCGESWNLLFIDLSAVDVGIA